MAGWIGVGRRPTLVASLLATIAVLALLFFLRTSLRPRAVELHITRPEGGAIVEGFKLRVEGTANPTEALVTLAVRSEKDKTWWVQDLVRPDPVSGRWAIKSHLGTPTEGKGENYYLVVLASADMPLTNFLLGRRLRTGMRLQSIPPWNQSKPLVVWRQR
ncbi:MAG TPA: hypothetical protein VF179_03655 [Thermoanaerobaculia bacterium]|nr:hypothetical protein [Thermoanaerobaculia bacterium]